MFIARPTEISTDKILTYPHWMGLQREILQPQVAMPCKACQSFTSLGATRENFTSDVVRKVGRDVPLKTGAKSRCHHSQVISILMGGFPYESTDVMMSWSIDDVDVALPTNPTFDGLMVPYSRKISPSISCWAW